MILSDNTDQNDHKPDFSDIDSIEKALLENDEIEDYSDICVEFINKLLIKKSENRIGSESGVSQIKESIDNIVEELLIDKLVSGYKCDIKYKEKSVIPSEIKIVASDSEGTEVFAPVINIW